jgi:hypothetical protein
MDALTLNALNVKKNEHTSRYSAMTAKTLYRRIRH